MNNLFRNKKKLMRIIVVVITAIIGTVFATNENASSVLHNILGVVNNTSRTESRSSTNTNRNTNTSSSTLDSMFGSVESDYSTTNRTGTNYSTTNKSSLPVLTNDYSTTNRDAFWEEYRKGYADGDDAAFAEKKENERIYGKK